MESVLKQIEGSWLLVSMTYMADGSEVNLYGKDPIGILTYDKNGYMNAQMGYSNRTNFQNQSLGEGTVDEIRRLIKHIWLITDGISRRSPEPLYIRLNPAYSRIGKARKKSGMQTYRTAIL
jgi:hypothetical protein